MNLMITLCYYNIYRGRVKYLILVGICLRMIFDGENMEHDYAWISEPLNIGSKIVSFIWVLFPCISILLLYRLYNHTDVFHVLFKSNINLFSFKPGAFRRTHVWQCMLTLINDILLIIYWFCIGTKGFLRNNSDNNNSIIFSNLWIIPTLIGLIVLCQLGLWLEQTQRLQKRKIFITYLLMSIIQLWFIICPCLCILLGPNSHIFIISLMIITYFLTFFETKWTPVVISFQNKVNYNKWIDPNGSSYINILSIYDIWFGWLLYHYMFFITGHKCNFQLKSIKAAFVGGFEFNFYRSGSLTALEQFSGQFFAFLFIPTLIISKVYYRFYAYYINKTWRALEPNEIIKMLDCIAYNMCKNVYILCIFSTLFVLCSMINSFIHRRHLLVWDIFAPKLVFDIIQITIIDIFTVINLLLIRYLVRDLQRKLPFHMD